MLAETTSSDDDQEEDHEVSLIINEEALVKNTNIFSNTFQVYTGQQCDVIKKSINSSIIKSWHRKGK